MKFADLHIHSIFSDGTFSPQEIIELSKKENLSCIAFADHDSIDAILNLSHIVDQSIEIIPAVELTAEEENCEIHILGYLIDYCHPLLLKKLDFLKERRLERIKEMIKKLNALNIDISLEDVKSIATHSCLTRLHLARALLKKGLISSILEGFQKYLGENSSCYVAGFYFKPQEAIRLIKDVDGIPVIAHPYNIVTQDKILSFINYGLEGIEVYYPEHTLSQISYYEGLAKKYGLLVTGGSDFHGEAKPQIKLGAFKVPYNIVEELKKKKYER